MKERKRLLAIDSLRGIAALSVVLFHFSMGANSKLNWIFRFGCTGVDLFFMISGFVIFLTLEKTVSYKDFLLSRFARLYPAYWACVSITSLLIIYVNIKAGIALPSLKNYLINLTMFQYYFHVENIDGPYWTLTIELLFYLFMLIVFLLKKLHKIEIIGAVFLLFSLINVLVFRNDFIFLNKFINEYLPLIDHIPLFIAGIVFYKIKFHSLSLSRSLLLLSCFIVQIFLYDYAGLSSIVMTQFEYVIIIAVYFLFFMLYTYNRLDFIVNKITLFLGKVSYSLYLIHQYVSIRILIPFFISMPYFKHKYWIAVIFIVLPIILILATLINKLVEIPAMKYLKSRKQLLHAS